MAAKSIVIDGVGGQGVRVIGSTMASLLAVMDYHVTLLFDYDSSVRGGMSEAFLAYDREPIANFVIECADVVLRLADRGPEQAQKYRFGEKGEQDEDPAKSERP